MWFARSVACKVFWIPPTPNSPCVHLLFFKISLQVKIPSALILVTDRDFPEVKTLSSLSPVSENRHFHLIQNLLCCQSCWVYVVFVSPEMKSSLLSMLLSNCDFPRSESFLFSILPENLEFPQVNIPLCSQFCLRIVISPS